jgi:phosphonate transport system substrate-binding protein
MAVPESRLTMSPATLPRRPRAWRSWAERLAIGLLLVGPPPAVPAVHYTLAVVPQMAPAVAHRDWSPFAERLGRETGLTLQLRVYRTFEEFETELATGQPDLAYINPYHQLLAYRTQGYLPLVRDGSRRLVGLLVVPRDSPLRSVRDLNGQHLGFPDPNAFAASLYLRALLQEREGVRVIPRYYNNHANVYRHVIAGDVAAGAGVNVTLERERPETRAELRVLYRTPGAAPHPLSAHPRVPAAVREALIAAVLRMARDEPGRRLLHNVEIHQPVRAVFARDYAPLERLQLQKYSVPTQLPAR